MKIYVITQGEYSDYHIITATLSKQRAENLAKVYSGKYEKAMVEEFEELSDEEIERKMKELEQRFVFDIKVDGTVGEVAAVYEKKTAPYMLEDYGNNLAFSIPAKDKEHAIKIARDMRYKCFAEKYGL